MKGNFRLLENYLDQRSNDILFHSYRVKSLPRRFIRASILGFLRYMINDYVRKIHHLINFDWYQIVYYRVDHLVIFVIELMIILFLYLIFSVIIFYYYFIVFNYVIIFLICFIIFSNYLINSYFYYYYYAFKKNIIIF